MTLDADGRADGPLLAGDEFQPGRYRLVFAVGDYFRRGGAELADPPFLDDVPLDFGIGVDAASTTTCRCSPARGRTRPTAAADAPRRRSGLPVCDQRRKCIHFIASPRSPVLESRSRRSCLTEPAVVRDGIGRLLAEAVRPHRDRRPWKRISSTGSTCCCAGPTSSRHRLDRLVVLLRLPRLQPDAADRRRAERARASTASCGRCTAAASTTRRSTWWRRRRCPSTCTGSTGRATGPG